MILPQPASVAGGWQVHDYRQRFLETPAAAGGSCSLDFGQVPQDELWLVERVVVSCTSSTATVCHLYDTSPVDARVLDGTRVGNFNVADNASPIQLPGGSTLLVKWVGASAGAVGSARIQYVVLRRAA